MKVFFWFLLGFSFALLVFSWLFFQSPSSDSVDQAYLQQYYVQNIIWGLLCGAVVGGLFGWIPGRGRFVRARSGESPIAYKGRVAGFGLYGAVLALLTTMILASFIASFQRAWELSEMERVKLALGSGRFLTVPAAALLGCLVAYVVVTRMRLWNGQRALL